MTSTERNPKPRRSGARYAVACVAALALFLAGFGSIAASSFEWPRSSRFRVAPLAQPSLDSKLAALSPGPDAGFSFTAFGDQRALAGGEWESMIASIDTLSMQNPRLLFMLDTGDIVDNGSHSDQFRTLAEILGEARSLPYLVGVGNHELDNNKPGTARSNTAAFVAPIDTSLAPDRLYYERSIGRVRFLFLDTNDLVYKDEPGVARRRDEQLAWLVRTLEETPDRHGYPTIAVMHHPILQSSQKHRGQARELWSLRYQGKTLPDILAGGGVDLILTGHTHTYERFRATRPDGKGFQLVNLSGRPRPAFLWFGEGARRAKMIPSGGERFWLYDRGWRGTESWDISQDDAMVEDEADQYAVFTVEPDGGITMAIRYMNRPDLSPPVRLLWGEGRSSLQLERKE